MKRKLFDVAILGGGLSGTLAAISAADAGAKVVLVERNAALGGMATLGLVQPITVYGLKGTFVVAGRGRALLEKLASEKSATAVTTYGPTCDVEALKYELERMCVERGVKILYNAWAEAADVRDGALAAVSLLSKSGKTDLRARVFVDATGDGDVAAFAGCRFSRNVQGATLMMIVSGVDVEKMPAREDVKKIWDGLKPGTSIYRGLCIFDHPRKGSFFFNMTETDGTDVLNVEKISASLLENRRQCWELFAAFRKHVPGFETAYIEQTAANLGVRESRHIKGLYTLTAEDLFAGKAFADSVATGASPIDVHAKENDGKGRYQWFGKGYTIPYRCLITRRLANLIVTGRAISADQAAHSSLRRMSTGLALGEAAGTAAALAAKRGIDVKQVPMKELQAILLRHGAILYPEAPLAKPALSAL